MTQSDESEPVVQPGLLCNTGNFLGGNLPLFRQQIGNILVNFWEWQRTGKLPKM